MKYVAMWNIPGCMPEMEPVECETFDEAKREIINELLHSADDYHENESEAEAFTHMAEDVNLESGPFYTRTMPDGYTYSVDEVQP